MAFFGSKNKESASNRSKVLSLIYFMFFNKYINVRVKMLLPRSSTFLLTQDILKRWVENLYLKFFFHFDQGKMRFSPLIFSVLYIFCTVEMFKVILLLILLKVNTHN